MKYTTSVSAYLLFALLFQVQLTPQEQSGGAATLRYSVIDLGTLGGSFSIAFGVNNRDWVTGAANLPGDATAHAVLWRSGKKMDLGTLGGPHSTGEALSPKGQIVGLAEISTPDPMGEDFCFFGTHLICLPFLWQEGGMSALPTLGGNNGFAASINHRGQVVGQTENSTLDAACPVPMFQAQAAIWESGTVRELFPTAGDTDGFANGINDAGQVVGGSGNCLAFSPPLHALRWQHGTVTDLGNLGGSLFSEAIAINNRGQVVGATDLPGDTNFFAGPFSNFHGFLWQNGKIRDLGTLSGDVTGFANAINNIGQVVGTGFFGNGQSRAFLWQAGVMADLNALVPGPPFSPLYLVQANAINDRGEIVGLGQALDGELHAYLAVPCNKKDSGASICDEVGESGSTESATLGENSGPNARRNPAPKPFVRILNPWVLQFHGRSLPGTRPGTQN